MIYTGIGSRDTPQDILEAMTAVGSFMAANSHTLRSGAAAGADEAFETGCDAADGTKEIYLPYMRFRGHEAGPEYWGASPNALQIARQFHPNWRALSDVGWLFMGRNTYQILGRDLKTPTDFVLCWTPGGKSVGGTSQALRLADHYRIPVFNLGSMSLDEANEEISDLLGI